MNKKLNDHNFLMIAMHYYDNVQCTSLCEFEEDLKRFMYLRKLFSKYIENKILKERLILNHLIILHNLFGIATTELLFYKIEKQYWNILATFLVYINRMPEEIPDFNLKLSDLVLDTHIINTLRLL